LYNVAFTLLPPFAIGVFDQIVSARMLEKYPQMYTLGRKDELFNVSIFWGWATNAIFHSLILYFLVVNSLNYPETSIGAPGFEGMDAGLFYGGLQLYACVLMTVLLKAGLTVE
jgi:phospholipid-transporting ATPase